eukprot:TRINITY_DN4710_c0_g2_i1.p1 TRINITY_DN4710_c0_g2~~TRINITY_DN4710_c0_g2_i1.p1  ORF type:complete len:1641 (+),score=515.86 TRINITY_DN4710_c0_g2_i1:1885-6807(+)
MAGGDKDTPGLFLSVNPRLNVLILFAPSCPNNSIWVWMEKPSLNISTLRRGLTLRKRPGVSLSPPAIHPPNPPTQEETTEEEEEFDETKLVLKVEIDDYLKLRSSRVVLMIFAKDQTVHQALLLIGKKPNVGLATDDVLHNYVLVIPNFDKGRGYIMANHRQLTSYGLKHKDTIVLKQRSTIVNEKSEGKKFGTLGRINSPPEPGRRTSSASDLKKKKTFDVSLEKALENGTLFGIPTVVHRAIEHIEAKGLQTPALFEPKKFEKEIATFRNQFDKGEDVTFAKASSPIVAACVLKEFLDGLPEPLLSFQLSDMFLSDYKKSSEAAADKRHEIEENDPFIQSAKFWISKLPMCYRNLLARWMEFLHKLQENSLKNGLTYTTLHMMFGPILIKLDSKISTTDEERHANDQTSKHIFTDFLRHYEILFVVPVKRKLRTLFKEEIYQKIDKVATHILPSVDVENYPALLDIHGVIWATNYRLVWRQTLEEDFDTEPLQIEIPLQMILWTRKFGKIRSKGIPGLSIVCKDFRTQIFGFKETAAMKTINEFITKHINIKSPADLFALSYLPELPENSPNGWNIYDTTLEYTRQGLSWLKWRISKVNTDNQLCSSYPSEIVVPTQHKDELFIKSAKLRTNNRFPIFTWGNSTNKACIFRAGAPIQVSSSQRGDQETKILDLFRSMNPTAGEKLRVIDVGSPQSQSWHEQAFPNCEITYLGIGNESIMQQSRQTLDKMVNTRNAPETVFKTWLDHIKSIIEGARSVVFYISRGESVLVQESADGDAAYQVISLAEMMLDPYFRTLEGFQVLIQMEWIDFGYPFASRLGHLGKKSETEIISPIFMQFLDAVWQLLYHSPTSFEFTEDLLLFIAHHCHSCLYGSFLCNNPKERKALKTKTTSIWTSIQMDRKKYLNPHYKTPEGASVQLEISADFVPHLWKQYYMKWSQKANLFMTKGFNRIDEAIFKSAKELDLDKSRLISLHPDVRKVTSLTSLNLSHNELNTIPWDLFYLTELRELNLENNHLANIPEEFLGVLGRSLPKLEILYLSCNQLLRLSSAIGTFTSLKKLELTDNRMYKLPDAILKLVNLEEILCSRNRFSSLPNLAELIHVHTLDVSGNLISTLASEMLPPNLKKFYIAKNMIDALPINFSLSQLEEFNLSFNKLQVIPPQFFVNHPKLKKLGLRNECLKSIPAEISHLSELVKLDLESNNLTDFPPILNLKNLTRVTLMKNQIVTLPNDIDRLSSLTELNISWNSILELPPSLGKISSLTALNISHNELDDLPPTLGFLKNLKPELFLFEKNKFRGTWKSTTNQNDAASLLGYLADLMKGSQKIFRMRLMVVGEENVGKTTLVTCLKKIKAKAEGLNQSTNGIAIDNWNLNLAFGNDKTKKDIQLTVWDFAGQEIYYVSHQFFMSKRSVYLLAWNLTKEPESSKLEFWLHCISMRAKDVPVFVVGTHLDDPSLTNDVVTYKMTKIKDRFTVQFPNLKLSFHKISCSNGENLKALRRDIEEAVVSQKHMGETIPTATLMLERLLQEEAIRRVPPIISRKEFRDLALKCNITDDQQLTRAAKLLHELGSMVYFETDHKLNDTVVLDPKWLTSLLATVWTTYHTFNANGILPHRALRRRKLIRPKLLKIWRAICRQQTRN